MRLKPDYNIDSIYEINAQELKARGVRALFFDLDSTVMKSKSGVLSDRTKVFLDELSNDFKIAIVTNNNCEKYLQKAISCCRFEVYGDAKKPDVKILKKAMEDLCVTPCESAFVGDRPLTDILVGKKANMTTILVDSISKDEEHSIVRFVRWLERLSVKG